MTDVSMPRASRQLAAAKGPGASEARAEAAVIRTDELRGTPKSI